jgi:hypothetical protein
MATSAQAAAAAAAAAETARENAKAAAAKKSTTPTASQSLNLYGAPVVAKPAAPVVTTKPTPKTTTITNPVIPGTGMLDLTAPGNAASARLDAQAKAYFAANPNIDPTTGQQNVSARTILSRTPVLDKDGNIIGWNVSYSDGTGDWQANDAYQAAIEAKGTTNVNVIKSLLLASGLPSTLVDSSIPFLQALVKDGIDIESAVDIYLNNKDFTTKDGNTVISPFYTQYGFYNDKMAAGSKYDAKVLFNTVEGYKTASSKYGLDPKFTAPSYIQNLLTNKWSVALFENEANKARLAAINADPTYVQTLKELNFINNNQDLTDFFMDSSIGVEKMQQNFNTVAFAQEAIRRANDASQIKFDKATAQKYGAQFTLQGLSEGDVSALASKGYESIARNLAPGVKTSGIYEGSAAANAATIQAELEAESFKGLESERMRRLAELNARSFQAQSGTVQSLYPTLAGLSMRKAPVAGQL